MANIEELDKNLENVKEKIDEQQTKANTTVNRNQKLQEETQLSKLVKEKDRLESQLTKEQWYGDSGIDSKEDVPYMKRFIEGAVAPSRAIAGVAENLLGKGEEPRGNIVDEIQNNIEKTQGWTSLLKKYDVPNSIALPAGFATDVALDPLNWAFVGTGSLVGRTTKGLKEAGLEGAKAGAKSRALQLAETGAKFTSEKSSRYLLSKEAAEKVGKKAYESTDEFYKLSEDMGYEEFMLKSLDDYKKDEQLTAKMAQAFDHRVENLEDGSWVKRAAELFRGERNFFNKQKRYFKKPPATEAENLDDLEMKVGAAIKNEGKIQQAARQHKQVGEDATINNYRFLKQQADEADDIANTGLGQAPIDTEKMTAKMAEEAINEKKFRKVAEAKVEQSKKRITEDTWQKTKDWLVGSTPEERSKFQQGAAKTLGVYEDLISFFKSQKIGLNPSAYTNAAVGNPIMADMMGVNIARTGYTNSIKRAFKLVNGRFEDIEDLKHVEKKFGNMMEQYPGLFKSIFGVRGKKLNEAKEILEAVGKGVKAVEKKAADQIKNNAAKALSEGDRQLFEQVIENLGKKEAAQIQKALDRANLDDFSDLADVVQITTAAENQAEKGTLLASEIFNEEYTKFLSKMDEKIKNLSGTSKKAMQGFKKMMTKPMDAYSKIDQANRLGLALHATKNGFKGRELQRIKRFVNLSSDDIAETADGMFKLSPMKAAELAQEAYLNYQSLPGAIKVLRQMPLMGAPFASFVYSMGRRTAKTAAYNPEVFSRVEHFLNSLEDLRPESERRGMKSKYNAWLEGKPTARLPFFERNPVYADVGTVIPFLSMNIFEPGNRNYEDSLGGEAARIIDSVPAFSDPIGQMMLDYLIYPNLYRNSENLRGQFGQRLWPKKASGMKKLGYGSRSFVESFMPGVAAGAGLVWPEEMVEETTGVQEAEALLPSYRGRQISHALKGETSIGYESKEGKLSQTMKALLDTFGLKFENPNIEYKPNNELN